jgi:replicative DNA helicase
MTELLRDHDTERALLAGVLSSPGVLRGLLADERLRPEHFAAESNGIAFEALVTIADRGEHPDTLTFAAELERAGGINEPRDFARGIAEQLPEPMSVRSYARRVRDLHRRRELKLASALLSEAADLGDAAKLAEAERLLTAPADGEASSWTALELAERFADRLDEPAPEIFGWPFSKLDDWTGGGLRRKQIVLIGGWTSNGKSVLYDQILEKLAGQGLRCHSYINEMSEQERMDRTVARLSGVPFGLVHSHRLTAEQDVTIRKSLPGVKVGMTECAGWSAPEIARHIRWNRWDVAGVDILHEIAHREERDLAEIAQTLRSTAKSVGCALIVCVHLNDNRVTTPKRPVPVLRDVRGSGMLVRGADVVLLVHRDDDSDGVPTNAGVLLAAKIRNGQPNAMGIQFQPERMRFLPKMSEPAMAGVVDSDAAEAWWKSR